MAKFLAYYNLCPIHDSKEFLGISKDRDKANIIGTLGKNIVMIIKISTQKQVRSWSVVEKLSSKVVYDQRSQKYVGVFAHQALRCWDETIADINKCKKIKFQRSIAELIVTEEDTYVLFKDGQCEKLADAIENRKAPSHSKEAQDLNVTYEFSDATIKLLPDNSNMLTYFERQVSTGELNLVRMTLESGEKTRFCLKRENMDVRVAGFAVIEGNETPMLLTIWSDKRLFLLNLTDTTSPESSPGDFVSVLTPLDVDSPLAVLGISKHFVAIYGANSGQDGVSLLLYNTQFKLIKARQYFKVYFNFSRLWTMDNYILLAMGQNLSVVSYQISKELLAELVGTQTNNEYEILMDHINEEETLQECLQYSSEPLERTFSISDQDVEGSDRTPAEFIEADGKFYPYEDAYDFNKTLNSLNRLHLNVDIAAVENSSLMNGEITLMGQNNYDWSTVNKDAQLIAHHLEQCGASEHEITEKLLPILIKADAMNDVIMCLRRYSNISEKVLSKTLSYALEKLTVHSSTPKLNGNSEDATTSSVTDVLNAVLSSSFDPIAIAAHIRRDIDYAKVIMLLEHLYQEVKGTEEDSFEPARAEFELQLLRWFGVCLNTHFQKLALSKDERLMELLLKWDQLFANYKREIVELEHLAALLYNIVQHKHIQKANNYSKWYSIEEVVLW